MNITYLIGNGFDISIGLHTKYEQFYRHLTKKNKFNKYYSILEMVIM